MQFVKCDMQILILEKHCDINTQPTHLCKEKITKFFILKKNNKRIYPLNV